MKEHDVVALTEDLPADGLHKGDVGAVVPRYQVGEIHEVEFIDERGRTRRTSRRPGQRSRRTV